MGLRAPQKHCGAAAQSGRSCERGARGVGLPLARRPRRTREDGDWPRPGRLAPPLARCFCFQCPLSWPPVRIAASVLSLPLFRRAPSAPSPFLSISAAHLQSPAGLFPTLPRDSL